VSIISNYLVRLEISLSGSSLTSALRAIFLNFGFLSEKEYAHILSMISGDIDSFGKLPNGCINNA